jgi:tetratricopeptide (TPR) repeat protein
MDWGGAIKEYDQEIAIDPDFGKAYANRGSARFNSQNYQGALDDFDNALRLLPDNPAVKSITRSSCESARKIEHAMTEFISPYREESSDHRHW